MPIEEKARRIRKDGSAPQLPRASARRPFDCLHPSFKIEAGIPRTRPNTGNMLVLCAAMTGVIVTISTLGIALEGLLCQRGKLQTETERSAMATACLINTSDTQGKMNNLVAHSRELVFESRTDKNIVDSNYPDLTSLADQLLLESRESAILIKVERDQLADATAQEMIKTVTDNKNSFAELSLPFIYTSRPTIWELEAGFIDGIDSNVESPTGNGELLALDMASGYIQQTSNLYKGNINARLPSPDNDLDFKISCLPAPVAGTTAPARLAGCAVFRKQALLMANGAATGSKCDQTPSAMKLTLRMTASSEFSQDCKGTLACSQTALSAGGTPLP